MVADDALRTRIRARGDAYRAGSWLPAAIDELRRQRRHLTRRGMVIGVSGGVDSATVAALAARAVPADRLHLVHLPDKDSDPESSRLALELAESLGTHLDVRDLTPVLAALGLYRQLDDHVATLLGRRPGDLQDWKLVRTPPNTSLAVRWRVAATLIDGSAANTEPLDPTSLCFIVARMNYKQRLRTAVLYSVADEERFMVVGTANRVELRTGFFVKNGDGAADSFPLACLYKHEVRELAGELGVPPELRRRASTTDTFSGWQSQNEFFFGLDEEPFDLVLFGFEHHILPAAVADTAGVDPAVVSSLYAELACRQPFLRYLLANPLTKEQP